MSHERQNAHTTDNLPEDGKQALSALRGVWDAQEQTSENISQSDQSGQSCETNSAGCKNVETNVGFQGLVDDFETPTRDNPSVSSNLRSAWQTKLEREGKQDSEATSIKDIVFGSSEPSYREDTEGLTPAEREATRTTSYPKHS